MTHKASPIYYEGHKVVRISDLPFTQASLFSGWTTLAHFISLTEKTDLDCVKYEDYEYWYQNYFVGEQDLNELI